MAGSFVSRLHQPLRIGPGRLAVYGGFLAFASLVFLVVGHLSVWRQGSDLVAFWSAARVVVEGRAAEAYDAAALEALQHAAGFTGAHPFLNPPPFLAAVAPLGLFSYPAALAVWVGAGYGAYALSTRWLPRGAFWPALAFPGGVLSAMAAQNGLLTTALLCGALGALPRRKLLAGVLIGLLIIKPQLALLAPVALAAGREWRARSEGVV